MCTSSDANNNDNATDVVADSQRVWVLRGVSVVYFRCQTSYANRHVAMATPIQCAPCLLDTDTLYTRHNVFYCIVVVVVSGSAKRRPLG